MMLAVLFSSTDHILAENAIPIEGWYSDRKDQHLLDLLPFLEALRFCDDVRSVLSMRYTG